jgi:hypothetical protein
MQRFCFFTFVLLACFFPGCSRAEKTTGIHDAGGGDDGINGAVVAVDSAAQPETVMQPGTAAQHGVAPWAILQAGEYPLWCQLNDEGPVLLETIDDAVFAAALIPWPHAPHIRFMLAQGDDLLMAVNCGGFLRLSPQESGEGAALYRFPGGEYWRQYTVDAFIMVSAIKTADTAPIGSIITPPISMTNEKPVALLRLNDRFLDSGALPPSPRLWTFDLSSPALMPLSLPSLDAYPAKDGWDIDSLRRGNDGLWYFRAARKGRPEIIMLRSDGLLSPGEQVSLGAFRGAALPEPLSAAPQPLREMLAAVFLEAGVKAAAVVSPQFQSIRYFAGDREDPPLPAFYSGAFLLATTPRGLAFFAAASSADETAAVRRFSLPPLPEGFVYTGIGVAGDTVFASWEEQEGYSIGAAGFMVIRSQHTL